MPETNVVRKVSKGERLRVEGLRHDRKVSNVELLSRAGVSAVRELFNAKELWPLFVMYLIAIGSVVILGADVATSSSGDGTVASVAAQGHNGNLTNFAGAIATPNGGFSYRMSCVKLSVGDEVHYEHDFLEGYQLVGTLPDNCTTV